MNNKQLIIALIILQVAPMGATPGLLDTTFGNQGFTLTPISKSDSLYAVTVQTDNKIIIVGSSELPSLQLLLARYTANGSLDTATFNTAGDTPGTQTLLVGSRTEGLGIALQSDGKIVVTGYAIQSQTNMILARYNTDGTPDTGFNSPNGYVTLPIGEGTQANAVGIQSIGGNAGKIIVAGVSVMNGIPNFALARFSSSGVLDTTFGTNGITLTQIGTLALIKSIAIQSDDKIVAVGNSNNQITIARYTANGSLDTTFNSGGAIPGILQPSINYPTIGYDIALDSAGRVIVVGSAIVANVSQTLVIRCTSSGILDTAFNGTGIVISSRSYNSEFYSVAIKSPSNYITAAGYSASALYNKLLIAQYTDTGTIDTGFGTNGLTFTTLGESIAAQDLKLQSTNASVTAGLADGVFCVARYTAS